jgi:hypothetical protein
MCFSPTSSRTVAASRSARILRFAICTSAALALSVSSASAATIVVKSGDGPLNTLDPNVQVMAGSTPTRALIIPSDPAWAPPIATSQWIKPSTSTGSFQSTRYTTTFTLPANAISPTLTVRVHADNRAEVSLNGHQIGSQAGECPHENFQGPPELFTTTTGLTAGPNSLAFDVFNCDFPTGLDFSATIDYQEGSPSPQGLDAFKCWTVSPAEGTTHEVGLSDLFGSGQASVYEGRQICNPVRTTFSGVTTPILHPEAHLTCRRTVGPRTAVKDVLLRGRLGTFMTSTWASRTLCLPSLQRTVPDRGIPFPPTGTIPEQQLDHFRCYDLQPQPAAAAVELLDEFGASNTTVAQLVRLCNPVEKTYQGTVTPIRRPQAHLACFTISDGGPNPPSGSFIPRDVVVRNQFGIAEMHVENVETLCVPTFATVLDLADV